MLFKKYFLPAMLFISLASVFILTGCVSEGAAFGLGSGSLHETVMTANNKSEKPEVYGPPQIIYQIDESRYFTLEEYTRCENGKTFYNNKSKHLHFQISPSSGYLFKGRVFWLSTRDDYLAFPVTRNDNRAACMGSEKGCLNIIALATDGGKTKRSVTYGANTQNPNGDTENFDILVNNEGFFIIDFKNKQRYQEDAVVWKWTFDPDEDATKKNGYPGATGPEYQKDLPTDDVSGVKQVRVLCDKTLEPINP